ncbi:MAG: hypothetical protein ACE5MK_04880 [Acidobacteriota bacterium]
MGIIRGIKRFFVIRENVFEISSYTGSLNRSSPKKARVFFQ